jgi:hypothetical protein
MVEYVRIYMLDASISVDLTKLNPDVQYVKNNPLFIIPYGSGDQLIFNIRLMSVRLTVTFDLIDGNGAGSNFEKLVDLSNKMGGAFIGEEVIFEWGSKIYYVNIESLVCGTKAGKGNIMQGCNMVLVPARAYP